MAKGLEGKRVVIAGSRKTEEMSTLIEKQGGVPLVRSLQGTVFLADQAVEPDLRRLMDEGADWVILTTGIGTEVLIHIAENMGEKERFLSVLQGAKMAARGYKTYSVLKKLDISPTAKDDDGTTQGLIRALEPFDFAGQRVVVQLHGDPAPRLIQFLEERGGKVSELLPYQHVAPEKETVEQFCRELTAGELDAVCFTAAIQVRFLFQYARENGLRESVLDAFENKVLAVAVGKICAEALREVGVTRILAPENERMGAMIIELAQYYEAHD
ncbi:uroporphyrinogen-III synthase [Ammoniphilus sp. CFH 90114]|uniref:uroporphyrinogen-III synthase n=1 Tax=Ammoniphilus sp. CFH 90114 TaxID=2493665 RepID=UPI00100F0587|nr:uroporphyrinogen-III synthase [Ammoniphilus sp. CFH 90114]RXT02851.1 uroporphyrinogen-III synthase [Ammoniphilus sp. CFH 90114]